MSDQLQFNDRVKRTDAKECPSPKPELPQGLHDYHGSAPGGLDAYEPVPGFEHKNGEKNARITARKLVWEIPEMQG